MPACAGMTEERAWAMSFPGKWGTCCVLAFLVKGEPKDHGHSRGSGNPVFAKCTYNLFCSS